MPIGNLTPYAFHNDMTFNNTDLYTLPQLPGSRTQVIQSLTDFETKMERITRQFVPRENFSILWFYPSTTETNYDISSGAFIDNVDFDFCEATAYYNNVGINYDDVTARSNYIISEGNVVVPADGKEVIFTAGNYVRLKSGFKVLPGGKFRANSEGCAKPVTCYTYGSIRQTQTSKSKSIITENIKKNMFVVYPNPVTDYLNISSIYDEIEIEIINIAGKVISDFRVNGKEPIKIDFTNIKNGVYIIILKTKHETCFRKIIRL